jgi:hypothetical protein
MFLAKKARCSFLKKRTKKLLLPGCVALPVPHRREAERKFFASFFQKRSLSF